ncbi:hypothetical protein EV383_3867 [Pseudonocardia sediminis]|uniref:Uncharacterized protein n=1 Tax=Pseudonocardia sediminis TaxID=1397368 RepID=A0A4Q7UY32_PSEST|nr:hypothetical protein [Pseudonocardia sediminis]RZT86962.1 hypothetical protein EV383_3867 [Pseudonocardia sediminis]
MQDRGPAGFTVVRCGGCADFPDGFTEGAAELPGVDEVLVEGLRALVRDSRHGVLVTAACPFGMHLCAEREIGMMLLVQPCDERRDPSSPVLPVGPIRSTSDVQEVTRWLVGRSFDPYLLPMHLRGPGRRTTSPGRGRHPGSAA